MRCELQIDYIRTTNRSMQHVTYNLHTNYLPVTKSYICCIYHLLVHTDNILVTYATYNFQAAFIQFKYSLNTF